jgi:hypothetical protein
MKTTKSVQRLIVSLILLSLTFILSSAGIVGAQNEQPPADTATAGVSQGEIIPQGGSPITGGPGNFPISSLVFKPQGSPGGCLSYHQYAITNTCPSPMILDATLNIPDKAVINQVVLYYSGTANGISVSLYLHPLMENQLYKIAEFSPTINTAITTINYKTYSGPFNYSTINLPANAYLVRVIFAGASDAHLNGVRIDYGYPVSLPVIVK